MSISKAANRHAGMTARLEEEIASQKAVVRRIDHVADTQEVAAAQSRLARLENMMKALRRQPT